MCRRKICLVTGSSRGIGAATALAAAAEGYDVCVNFISHEREAGQIVAEIEKLGRRAISVRADISKQEEVKSLFSTIDRELGSVTALVNNASIAGSRIPFLQHVAEDFARVLAVNLMGTVYCTAEALARMQYSRGGQGGAIVNVSSLAIRTGGRDLSPYVASKGGVASMGLSAAKDNAAQGVRINEVCPGVIETDQQPLGDPKWLDRMVESIPMRRLGKPEEVAHAIMFLLSDRASYITGARLDVHGGR